MAESFFIFFWYKKAKGKHEFKFIYINIYYKDCQPII